jgi:hypothetical protein
METIFITNVTQYAFFRYNKKHESDTGYNKLLLELLTPPFEEDSNKKSAYSHWDRKDKIVIAPKNTHEYVERLYNELYL